RRIGGRLVLGGCPEGTDLVLHVLAASQPRRRSGDNRHEGGGGEDDAQAVHERLGDQLREERLPRQIGRVCRRQGTEHVRPEQGANRVVAQEGGEQGADRRQVGDPGR